MSGSGTFSGGAIVLVVLISAVLYFLPSGTNKMSDQEIRDWVERPVFSWGVSDEYVTRGPRGLANIVYCKLKALAVHNKVVGFAASFAVIVLDKLYLPAIWIQDIYYGQYLGIPCSTAEVVMNGFILLLGCVGVYL